MVNRVIFMVLAGIFAFLWYWVGYQDFYAGSAGSISDGYLFVTIATVAITGAGAAGTGGLVDVYTAAIRDFVPKLLALIVALLLTRLIYELVINTAGFQAYGLVETLAVTVAAGLLTHLTMTSLRNAG